MNLILARSRRNQTLRHKSIVGFLGSESYLFIPRGLQLVTQHVLQVARTFGDLLSLCCPESLQEAKKKRVRAKSRSSVAVFVLNLALVREGLTVRPVSLDPSAQLVIEIIKTDLL